MSYTALYRKFRPDTFADVKGQDAIVQTLKNQVISDRVGHAYLFCGTRGTGKTTVAKILARAVNCEHPVDGSPCNECASCRAIAAGRSMNVVEIDAASNNGVDNIREIREEVAYSPTEGRYRVYIIDEVHMLSIGAFNALLKTLEEPPSYVIFILATTEANKIPVTILSRCQRYDFKRIPVPVIEDRLKELLTAEQTKAEDKAVRYIALKADGALRDALSLLDQCMAFYPGQPLTYEQVLDVLGAVDTEVFSRMLRNILKRDVKNLMHDLDGLVMQGRELGQFVTDFTWYLRNLLLLKSSDGVEDVLDISAENMKLLQEEASLVPMEALMRYIRIFSELANRMKLEASKRLALEVALIKLCRPEMERDDASLLERIRNLEQQMAAISAWAADGGSSWQEGGFGGSAGYAPGNASGQGGQPAGGTPGGPAEGAPSPEAMAPAAPEEMQRIVAQWDSIVDEAGGAFRATLKTAQPKYSPSSGESTLYIEFPDFLGEKYIHDPEKKALLENIIASRIGHRAEVKMVIQKDAGAAGLNLQEISIDEKIRRQIHMEVEVDDSGAGMEF